jgi:hypothetical protein
MISLGRNILIPEYSFYTDFTNLTNESKRIGIFGQGMQESTQFAYRNFQHCTGNVKDHFNSDLETTHFMQFRVNYTGGGFTLFAVAAGTTRDQLLLLLYQNTGRIWNYFEVPSLATPGNIYFQFQVQSDVTSATVTSIQFTGPLVTFFMTTAIPNYLSDNFVAAKSTIDLATLFRSQTGEVYNVLAMGVNSDDVEQVENPFLYLRKTAEGNMSEKVTPIVIDINAYHTSILNVVVDWMIDGNSTIIYDLQPGEEFPNPERDPNFGKRVRIYWTYVDLYSRDHLKNAENEIIAVAERLAMKTFIDEIRFSREYVLDESAA